MLPNILVKPSEIQLNNLDFDCDINFYDAISKYGGNNSSYNDANRFNKKLTRHS